ncbi:MAG TPA: patatin-like phospholipase family protein [Steroidobacteraceae bacterium]
MRLAALILAGLLLARSAGSAPAADAAPGAPDATRPRIGLVLSGGGARGAAHIGVLKVLDELHLHVDAIAGTSMGAVVGGLYASGMSGRQIESLFTSVDWQDAFSDRPRRADLGFRRKQEDRDFLVNLPLGVQGHRLQIPTGLIQGQKLTQLLRRATLPVADISRFDELPTRFRAVATDLESGNAVIMDSGDLTTALRASMSAPGFLAPVERDGRLLVDGGLVENLPIDVARSMGVDVLIVVDAGFPLQTRDRLNSLTSVSNQALAILVRRDVERQRATLGPRDLLLQPALGQRNSYDFGAVPSTVRAGEEAARAVLAQLTALAARPANGAVSAGGPAVAAANVPAPAPVVKFITTDPASARYASLVREVFADQLNQPLQPELVARRIADIYGRGNLEQLDYRLVQAGNGDQGLEFTARRNSWGPNYLRLGLSLQDDFAGNSTFNAAMRLSFTELNALNAESVLDLQIGASPRVGVEFYQPLSAWHRYFVAPHLLAQAHDLPQLDTAGTRIGTFRVRSFEYGVDVGREFGNWGELRGGIVDSRGSTTVRLGDFNTAETSYHVRASFLSFNYDRLDSSNFPRSGQALSLGTRFEQQVRGAPVSDLLTLDWRGAWSRGKNTGLLWVSGGSTIGGSDTNVRSFFPLGGFLSLSGLPAQSLAGPHYAIARALYFRSVGSGGEGVLNVPAYAGLSVELGNVWATRSDLSFSSARRDAALFFGADTYIGPVYLAAGYDESGVTAFYLFLGRSF